MDYYTISQGEMGHLSHDDMAYLTATLMTLRMFRARSRKDIIEILETCLVGAWSEDPWSVIHDEDLIALHRGDDDKPVLLFTKRAQ